MHSRSPNKLFAGHYRCPGGRGQVAQIRIKEINDFFCQNEVSPTLLTGYDGVGCPKLSEYQSRFKDDSECFGPGSSILEQGSSTFGG